MLEVFLLLFLVGALEVCTELTLEVALFEDLFDCGMILPFFSSLTYSSSTFERISSLIIVNSKPAVFISESLSLISDTTLGNCLVSFLRSFSSSIRILWEFFLINLDESLVLSSNLSRSNSRDLNSLVRLSSGLYVWYSCFNLRISDSSVSKVLSSKLSV
ncbi:hypothetical protein WICPIJ_000448 [Wickerhamomyces pijperi]|uniref:Secreted protein n=1 Tax=Wickerhamomyces pijperi TaxID=599730 RepID=A0A9P8QDI0_WICPI|nr:hypothetical protein WICPIJ_000448 [Wickerhamomyces pijperi]